jgi:hypothetical protein
MNGNGTERASTENVSHWGEMYKRSRRVILTTAKQDLSWKTFSLRVIGGGFDRYACINDYKRLRRAATTSTSDR